MNKLSQFMTVRDAATYLGVSPNTLRNWESAGKIVAHRHPVNRYRLFKKEELDAILIRASEPSHGVEKSVRKPR
jgi:DNA (cytosine-5)-methyltransferase 1